MKLDSPRKFVTVTNVDADNELDVHYCTEATLLAGLRIRAENYYDRFPYLYSVCVIDFENRVSTIYEYACEKTVKITCTSY